MDTNTHTHVYIYIYTDAHDIVAYQVVFHLVSLHVLRLIAQSYGSGNFHMVGTWLKPLRQLKTGAERGCLWLVHERIKHLNSIYTLIIFDSHAYPTWS